MIKDITLGQFYPGNSAIHRMDPRVKIMLTLFLITVMFFVRSYYAYGLLAVFIVLVTLVAKIPLSYMLRSLKPLLFIILFTFVLNLFLTGGETVLFSWWIFTVTLEGVHNALFFMLRLVLLITGMSLLTLTTSPLSLTDGIERLLSPFAKIGFPSHELAMMMSIALRFIPIILEETDKIMKAQMARGADFESGNLLRRAKALIPILVPLFVSAFRRADELAMAMEARCYHGGEGRTRLKVLKLGTVDLWCSLVFFAVAALVVLDRYVFLL